MKKTLAILLSVLMLALMAIPAMATDTTICETCGKNTYQFYATVSPTCTEDGYTLWKCANSECGIENRSDFVDALGHDYPGEYEHVDGGCTKETYDIRYCKRCGREDKINIVAAPGHTWDAGVHKAAGCEIMEHDLYTCTVCQTTRIENTFGGAPFTGHKMKKISGPETCKDEAVIVYECEYCGKQKTEATTAVAHVDADDDGVCDVCLNSMPVEEEVHGFYAKIIKWITDLIEAFKALLASIKGDSIF